MGKETHCQTKLESIDFKQMVEKPKHDIRIIIDR